eukprot:m.121344 g.121344  ORF g.121344 m.121344 type:complete len:455 (+) comp14389_c0_seq2:240-1604(+)
MAEEIDTPQIQEDVEKEVVPVSPKKLKKAASLDGMLDAVERDDRRGGTKSLATSRASSPIMEEDESVAPEKKLSTSQPRTGWKEKLFTKSHNRRWSAGDARAAKRGKSPADSSTYNRLKDTFDKWLEGEKEERALQVQKRIQNSPEFGHLDLSLEISQELDNEIRAFMKKFEKLCKKTSVTLEDLSAIVLKTYDTMFAKISSEHPVWLTLDEDKIGDVADGFERYIMSHIYDLVFSAEEEDEEKDIVLQERIREFRWIEPRHLDASFDLENENVLASFHKAQEELIVMDSKHAPIDKMKCVVEASKAIFTMLEKSKGNEAGADDFMPVLIYCLLQANPPMIYSNLQFLNRFCNPEKLNSGEAGYYFTNLYSAVSFIEQLSSQSLKISDGEFYRQIHGANAYKSLPPMKHVQMLKRYQARCNDLKELQEAMQEMMDKLHSDIDRLRPAPTEQPME